MLRRRCSIGTLLLVAVACGRTTRSLSEAEGGTAMGGAAVAAGEAVVGSGGALVGSGGALVGSGGRNDVPGCGEVTEALGPVPRRSNAILSDGPTLYFGGRTLDSLDKLTRERRQILGPSAEPFKSISAIAADAAWLYLGYRDGSLAKVSKQDGRLFELSGPSSPRSAVSALVLSDRTLLVQTGVALSLRSVDSGAGFGFDAPVTAATMDMSSIYYVSGTALWRIPRSNPGTVEQVAEVAAAYVPELILGGDFVYYSAPIPGGGFTVFRVSKSLGGTEAMASPDDTDDFSFVVTPNALYWQSPAGALYKTPLEPKAARVQRSIAQYGPFDTDDYPVLITADEHFVFWVASENPSGLNEDTDDTLTIFSTCAD